MCHSFRMNASTYPIKKKSKKSSMSPRLVVRMIRHWLAVSFFCCSRRSSIATPPGARFRHRHVKFGGNRRDDQEERGEVEGIERPPEPRGHPGIPLILGGLAPPWNHCRLERFCRRHSPPPLFNVARLSALLALYRRRG